MIDILKRIRLSIKLLTAFPYRIQSDKISHAKVLIKGARTLKNRHISKVIENALN